MAVKELDAPDAVCPCCKQLIHNQDGGNTDDLMIRCVLCRTPHHLSCFAEGGCVVFGCLKPEPMKTEQTEIDLAESIFRAELRDYVGSYSLEPWLVFFLVLLSLSTVALLLLLFETSL